MTEEQYQEINLTYTRFKNAEEKLKRITTLRDEAKKDYERSKDIYCLTETIFHNPSLFAASLPDYFFSVLDKNIKAREADYDYLKSMFESL